MSELVIISTTTRKEVRPRDILITIDEKEVPVGAIPKGAIPFEDLKKAEQKRARKERLLQERCWVAGLTLASQERLVANLTRIHLLGNLPDGSVVVTPLSEVEVDEEEPLEDYFARS